MLNEKLGGTVPDFTGTLSDDGKLYKDLLTSKKRDYTYRGKYAYTVGGTEVDNDHHTENTYVAGSAEEFPLTNKLDYVFYRHLNVVTPMEVAGASGNEDEYYTTTYDLTEDATAALYPWTYGWAIVEDPNNQTIPSKKKYWNMMKDAAKLEDTWTTFGVGELTNLDPSSTTLKTDFASALNTPVPVYPGGLTTDWSADPAKEPMMTGYTYKTSDSSGNSYLSLADFSDMSKLLKSGQDVLIVKAVYEPGESLLGGFQYTMVGNPYYNKMNAKAASAGGAYSAEVTLERINRVAVGELRGVSRVRSPAIRMDTTSDNWWLTNAELGINHNLPNSTQTTAEEKTETTYTKVNIDTGEVMIFTLSLSARVNTVDYMLVEQYGDNFIVGTQRSYANFDNKGTDQYIINNYNYYLKGDSNESDNWLDITKFDEKSGSHGFVLYGTLNRFLQQASEVNQKKLARDSFESEVNFTVFPDANIRVNNSGSNATFLDQAIIQDALRAMASDASAFIGTSSEAQYWNAQRNCAELSYHQVQWYVLNGGTLLDRATAEDADHKLAWCHLHADCAASVSNKPTTWTELLNAAGGVGTASPDDIESLLPGEVESLFHLRANSSGGAFASPAAFRQAVEKAVVQGGATTWDEVQYYIVHQSPLPGSSTEPRDDYWWYDGATSKPMPGSLGELITLALDAINPVTLPDGSSSVRYAKFNEAKNAWQDNDDAAADAVAGTWRLLTQNLVLSHVTDMTAGTGTTTKFSSFDDFRNRFLTAVSQARDAGMADLVNNLSWYQIQYAILHRDDVSFTFPVTPSASQQEEFDTYWWHNGERLVVVKDLVTMFEAAKMANGGNASAWDKFVWQTVADHSELVFSKTFDGQLYDAASLSDLKDKVKAFVRIPGAKIAVETDDSANRYESWISLQYYLIHNSDNVTDAYTEANGGYYWWKDGGTAAAPAFASGGNISNFINAAFVQKFNGVDETTAWSKMSSNAIKNTNLRSYDPNTVASANKKYTFSELSSFVYDSTTIKSKFISLLTTAMAGNSHPHTPPTLTWYQIQDYLLTGNYTPNPDAATITRWEKLYWWKDGSDDPDKPTNTKTPVDTFIETYLASDTTIDTITNDILVADGLAFRPSKTGKSFNAKNLSNAISYLKMLIAAAPDVSQLTWYQIQYSIINKGAYADAAKAATDGAGWTWAPAWVTSS